MEDLTMCRIPISITYRCVDGELVKVAAEYRDIPADVVALFLIQKFGRDIPGFGEVTPG